MLVELGLQFILGLLALVNDFGQNIHHSTTISYFMINAMENVFRMRWMRYFPMMIVGWLLLIPSMSWGSSQNEIYYNESKYHNDTVFSDFKTRFPTEEDRTNFKGLRRYLSEKNLLQKRLIDDLQNYYDFSHLADELRGCYLELIDLLKKKPTLKQYPVSQLAIELGSASPKEFWHLDGIDSNGLSKRPPTSMTEEEVRNLIENLMDNEKAAKRLTNIRNALEVNLGIVMEDVSFCESAIDSALAPEYKNQQFREKVAMYFSIVIALVVVFFFVAILIPSSNKISHELLSSKGLQFVTVFVLIIAVILFGILGILESSELAAILAGISGYILGKGNMRSSNGATTPDAPPTPTPPPTPPAA